MAPRGPQVGFKRPEGGPKRLQNGPKKAPERRFLCDLNTRNTLFLKFRFCSYFVVSLVLFGPFVAQDGLEELQDGLKVVSREPPNGFQEAQRWPQEASRWSEEGPKGPKMANMVQNSPRMGSRWSQEGPKWASRGPTVAPKGFKMGRKRPQEAPTWFQQGSNEPQNEASVPTPQTLPQPVRTAGDQIVLC